MEYSFKLRIVAYRIKRILVCFSVMNYYGLADVGRKSKLADEYLLLFAFMGIVPVIIKPDLAYCPAFFS